MPASERLDSEHKALVVIYASFWSNMIIFCSDGVILLFSTLFSTLLATLLATFGRLKIMGLWRYTKNQPSALGVQKGTRRVHGVLQLASGFLQLQCAGLACTD